MQQHNSRTAEKRRTLDRRQAHTLKRSTRYGDAVQTLVDATNLKRAEVLRAIDERGVS